MRVQTVSRTQRLLAGVAALAFMGCAGAASAADQPKATDVGEVVVTAEKKEQKLLDVPVPVTTLSSDTLIQQNLVSFQDYAGRIPGLRITGNRIYLVSLRGVAAFGGSSATTGVLVDDVPFVPAVPGAQGILPDFDPGDLARIEVLRGPQGTLYGASAMGGLIKYVTINPNPNDFSGRLEGGVNSSAFGGNGYSARGMINMPLWEDKLAIRVSAYKRKDPAYLDTVAAATPTTPRTVRQDVNSNITEGFRGALFFKPVDNLTINVSHMEQKLDQGIIGAVNLTAYPTNFKPTDGYYTTTVGDSATTNRHKLTQAKIDWTLPFATLTSATGWVRTGGSTDQDVSRSFPFIFTLVYPGSPAGSQARIVNATHTKKFSQELRLGSSEGPLEWQVGGFYTDEDANLFQDLKAYTASRSLIGDVIIFPNHYTLKEKAVFASVTYHFTDQFSVQVGGRYSDLKQTSQTSQTTAPAAAPAFGASVVNPLYRQSENSFTWLVTPQYKINQDLMVYARIATGYRPGGSNDSIAPNPTFESDKVTNYELGAKGRFLDRRLTIDASVFDIEWSNIQLAAATPLNLSYNINAGKARIQGLEAAGELNLGAGWRVSGNTALTLGQLNQDFPQTVGAANTLAYKGDQLPGTARFTANLGLEKSWNVFADYRLTLGGNLTHIGDRAGNFRSSTAAATKRNRLKIPGYDQVDLYATISNGVWSANAYIRNVGDAHGLITADDGGGRVAVTSGVFIAPQVVGVSLARNF